MIARRRFAAVAAAATLAACADLAPLDSQVCGNGVKDETEDCDTFADPDLGPGTMCAPPSDSARACRYVCSDSVACPIGWGCGPDGVCRFSSGQFSPSADSPVSLPAERLEVGDVDGDHSPDLIGFRGPRIGVRFGAPDGRFATALDTVTDSPTGAQAIADLDADGRTDIIIPQVSGLFVLLGQADETLAPIAFAPFSVPAATNGLQVYPLRPENGSPFDALMLLVGDCMQFFDGTEADCALAGTKFPNKPPGLGLGPWLARDIAGRIPRGNLDGPARDAEEMALAFSQSPLLYVYTPQTNATSTKMQLKQTIAMPAGQSILYGAEFADVDGDGDLDIITSVGTPDQDAVALSMNDGLGNFPPTAFIDPTFDQMMAPDPGGGPIMALAQRYPLATGDFNGDGVADYVGQSGVFLRVGNTLFQSVFHANTALWAEAAVADFNRDGFLDVAAVSEGVDGVDFFIGTGTGLFNPSHIETGSVPFFLRSGDFDGDLVDDLAMGLSDPVFGRGNDSLAISFGNLQGPPSEPISMGHLQSITFLEPSLTVTNPSNLDMISDVVVQSQSQEGDASLAIMFGSAQRRLISPFTLQKGSGDPDVPIAVAAGKLDPGGDDIADLLALAPPRLWLIKGSGAAQFNAQDAHDQELTQIFGAGGNELFDPLCAMWLTTDVDGDGKDDVVGIDEDAQCGFGFGASPTPRMLVAKVQADAGVQVTLTDATGFAAPREIKLADLDGDGQQDLIVVYTGDKGLDMTGTGPGVMVEHDGVVVYWGDGTGFSPSNASSVPAFPGATVRSSAVAINADADKELELAVLTDNGVYITNFDAGRTFDAPASPVIFDTGSSLQAADVDADGLADLVFEDQFNQSVLVYLAQPSGASANAQGVKP